MNSIYDELRAAIHSVWNRRWLALAGQDYDPNPSGTETNVLIGTTLLNDHVVMLWPYVGSTVVSKISFLELLDPKTVTLGGATAYAP